jgi:hypothetical protein
MAYLKEFLVFTGDGNRWCASKYSKQVLSKVKYGALVLVSYAQMRNKVL